MSVERIKSTLGSSEAIISKLYVLKMVNVILPVFRIAMNRMASFWLEMLFTYTHDHN